MMILILENNEEYDSDWDDEDNEKIRALKEAYYANYSRENVQEEPRKVGRSKKIKVNRELVIKQDEIREEGPDNFDTDSYEYPKMNSHSQKTLKD